MAYKLELPAASRVQPIFHVSSLKKIICDKIQIQTIFTKLNKEGKIILEPKEVIEIRIGKL